MTLPVRIAIVDDDADIHALLDEYMSRYQVEYSADLEGHEFFVGLNFLEIFTHGAFDIIFLDIEMPHMNGMDVARHLRKIDEDVIIIFITNLTQYAIQGYEVQASDYIVKPLSYFDFALKMSRILKTLSRKAETTIALETTGGLHSVNVSEIAYIESKNHYVLFTLTNGQIYRVRDSITNQLSKLEQYGFVRTHKSFAVNMRHIESIHTNMLICADTEIPIGRSYKKDIQPAYLNFLGGN